DKHLYICGGTGTGKSKFLENLIRQDICNWSKSRCGMLVLDPHCSLYDNLINWLAWTVLERPIIPIDLRQDEWVVAYNVVRQRQLADPAARDVTVEKPEGPALRQGYAWRRGELNPCPRRYLRKHLHVCPAKSSEEPSHAPAHCRLPSVHEIDSRTSAVAPPIRQPAVHVFAASRRHYENVAIN